MENKFQNIAVFIDAENISYKQIESVFKKIEDFGKISLKRVYGNFSAKTEYEDICTTFSLKTIHQFSVASGKNSSDILLAVDAMDCLYKNIYDCFVIVSSDSDFTALCQRIREEGIFLIGVGEKGKVTDYFKNSCEEFISLENNANDNVSNQYDSPAENAEARLADSSEDNSAKHSLILDAYKECRKIKDGYVLISAIGMYIKSKGNIKHLEKFIKKYPQKYEVEIYKNGIKMMKCLD